METTPGANGRTTNEPMVIKPVRDVDQREREEELGHRENSLRH